MGNNNQLTRDLKAKFVIKVLLCANKGKKMSGKEISRFVNENNLLGNRTDLPAASINRLVRASQYPQGILENVNFEKEGHLTMYWIEA